MKQNREIDPYTYAPLRFGKFANIIQRRNDKLSPNVAGAIGYP